MTLNDIDEIPEFIDLNIQLESDGSTHIIQCSSDMTIKELRINIRDNIPDAPSCYLNICLYYDGYKLNDRDTIGSCDLHSGDTLVMNDCNMYWSDDEYYVNLHQK
jgi:hypothetical protein